MGKNPQNGKEIKIPAKKVAKFKPGKTLAEVVNQTIPKKKTAPAKKAKKK
ncbi:MAG: DNA-binding protein, partial [Ignavibacteria bacterium]|nr:DNA-binding protein [Ignavibacteria bacterium]